MSERERRGGRDPVITTYIKDPLKAVFTQYDKITNTVNVMMDVRGSRCY